MYSGAMKLNRVLFMQFSSLVFSTLCVFTIHTSSYVPCMKQDGTPSEPLAQLLKLSHVSCDAHLSSVVAATQKSWIRPANTERYDLVDNFSLEEKEALAPLFKKLGVVDAIEPTKKNYEHALLLGGLTERVVPRIQELINQWNKGIRFKNIAVLVGERSLIADEIDYPCRIIDSGVLDSAKVKEFAVEWQKNAKTEASMVTTILNHCAFPEDMLKEVTIMVVNVPNKKKPDGTEVRANTMDTVVEWMKHNPMPGCCLAISTQPHVLYQESVLKTFLPSEFPVEAVGPQITVEGRIAEMFDALARLLYQEKQRLEKSGK